MANKKYGWIPDVPDKRDHQIEQLGLGLVSAQALPSKIDLSTGIGPCYDQGQTSSCVGNGIAGIIEFLLKKEKKPVFTPSRLFIYANGRIMENSLASDSGAMIRDGVKSINLQGACSEVDWPFDIKKVTTRPNAKAYKSASVHKTASYARVRQDTNSLKICLASGYPVVFGFSVYESFESDAVAETGIMPMPGPNEELLGGHCVNIFGYSDETQMFLCLNSWGGDVKYKTGKVIKKGWGQNGYFWQPYQFTSDPNFADDFWVIHQIS